MAPRTDIHLYYASIALDEVSTSSELGRSLCRPYYGGLRYTCNGPVCTCCNMLALDCNVFTRLTSFLPE